MILISIALSTLGLVAILSKPNFMGVLIGVHLLGMGVASTFVLTQGGLEDGSVFGFLMILINSLQVVVGFALGLRLFFLKRRTGLSDLRELRH